MSALRLRQCLPLGVVLVLCSMLLSAQAPPPAASDAADALPVRRVVLYKTGIGYFEHRGTVTGAQAITIRFTSAQLNDVLKSLTAIDLGKGQVTGISYNSVAPVEQRLEALRLPLGAHSTMADLLASLRGARIEITSAGEPAVTGRLLSVEKQSQRRGDGLIEVPIVSVVTDPGELRNFELTPAVRIRLSERSMRDELTRYLDVLGSTREQDVRNMVISTSGSGERPLFVSYISEVPIWKSSYRLVFPQKGQPLLQGWAIVDNTIGEDWRGVQLSLVAGAPQSYIQQLSQPLYGRRPEVPMPSNLLLQPQTHGGTLRVGRGMVSGTVRDVSGGAIAGVTVELRAPSGEVINATTGAEGRFEVVAPAGQYQMRVAIPGFVPVTRPVLVPAGGTVTQDVALRVGGLAEAVEMRADALAPTARPAPPPPAAPMPYEELRESAAAATGADLGELFEYRIKEPVTLQKNQSALVPIVSSAIEAERVSLWNGKSGSGRPRRAMWLTNTTGLTLDGGSVTIIDGDVFAGEGLLESLTPSERRLVSYASDLSVLVEASTDPLPARLSSLTIRDGIITQQAERSSTTTYAARNEGSTPARLLVEHGRQPGWTLAAGQTPVETTAGADRFQLTLPPAGENTLAVTEISARTSRVRVADAGDPLIAELAASGVDAGQLEQALRPVFVAKGALAALDRQISDIDVERKRIVDDQQRLRENMKALRGSSEERQLLQRYTRQLDEQESRLGELHTQRERLVAERAAAAANLSRAIESVSFDWARR